MATAAALNIPFSDEDLWQLLRSLEARGFAIGMDQFLAIQLLLTRLAERDALPANPYELARHIGPVVCGSAAQQRDFPRLFDIWLGPLVGKSDVPPPRPIPMDAEREILKALRTTLRRQRLLRALSALLCLGLALLLYIVAEQSPLFQPSGGPKSTTVPPLLPPELAHQFERYRLAIQIAGLLVAAGIIISVISNRRFLNRRLSIAPPNFANLSLDTYEDGSTWLPPVHRDAVARMRHRVVQSDDQLDVEATVLSCARAAGQFVPVYATRSRVPEYLILIDRAATGDLQAARATAIVAALAAEAVYAKVYYFDGDARTLYDSAHPEPVSLAELYVRHPEHRLIVCAEAAGFLDPLTGRPYPWLSRLGLWAERSLLTLVPVVDWGTPERTLSSIGFKIFPCMPDGFAAVSEARLAQRVVADARGVHPPRYPDRLADDELAWIDQNAPNPADVRDGLGDVRRYLSDIGYEWLAACAVYPEINPRLALYLGDRLASPFQASILERFARLPWMRRASMPDWLRLALLRGMGRKQERRARELLRGALLAPPGSSGSETVRIALQDRRGASALWRACSRLWRREEPVGSPLRDNVFLSWMDNRLAFRLKRLVQQWLVERRRARIVIRSDFLSPDTAHYYRPLAAMPLRHVPRTLLLVGCALGVGALYGVISGWLSGFSGALGYIVLAFFTAIAIVGVSMTTINGSHIRGRWPALAVASLEWLLFEYTNWLGWAVTSGGFARTVSVYRPSALLSRMVSVGSTIDYVLWVIETLLLALLFLYSGIDEALKPYCVICRTWTKQTERVYGPFSDQARSIREILHGAYRRLFALARGAPHEMNATWVRLEQCSPECTATTLISISEQKSSRSEGVLVSKTLSPIVGRLYVPEHVARSVAEWITATPNIRYNSAPESDQALRRVIEPLLRVAPASGTDFWVYGDIPADKLKEARRRMSIPSDLPVAALTVSEGIPLIFPWYNAQAFTATGVYSVASGTTKFTAYKEMSDAPLDDVVALQAYLETRGMKAHQAVTALAVQSILRAHGKGAP
jgi:hypothetical protein